MAHSGGLPCRLVCGGVPVDSVPRPELGSYKHRPYSADARGLKPPYLGNALLIHGVLGAAALLALGAAMVGMDATAHLMMIYQEGLPPDEAEPFTRALETFAPLALGSAVSGLLYWQLNWMVVRRRRAGPAARLLFAVALAPAGMVVQLLLFYLGVYWSLIPGASSIPAGLYEATFAALLSTLVLAVVPAGWTVFFPVALAQSIGSSLMLQRLTREPTLNPE